MIEPEYTEEQIGIITIAPTEYKQVYKTLVGKIYDGKDDSIPCSYEELLSIRDMFSPIFIENIENSGITNFEIEIA